MAKLYAGKQSVDCDLCGLTFKDNSGLSGHKRYKHGLPSVGPKSVKRSTSPFPDNWPGHQLNLDFNAEDGSPLAGSVAEHIGATIQEVVIYLFGAVTGNEIDGADILDYVLLEQRLPSGDNVRLRLDKLTSVVEGLGKSLAATRGDITQHVASQRARTITLEQRAKTVEQRLSKVEELAKSLSDYVDRVLKDTVILTGIPKK